ncbi:MAG: hypothetical protein A7316_00700 [Candidatus Altiarchaeales archaeon WOR_SM1_86-2]|nr:MAG: hypothetical protein A7315_05380 [Candidatus Altiarchaeales archaeon WOR_SM1_79]ODS39027.1 MAG: hypothetical protein A7316_00700 [Candidatus Altiarchaeales archaeon WOR_SM1_86-2]
MRKIDFVVSIVVILMMSGCITDQPQQPSDEGKGDKIKIMDHAGRTVYVPVKADRIVSLWPEATRVVMALNASKLVGVSNYDKRDPIMTEVYPNLKNLPAVGDMQAANAEEIVALKPDVIFGDAVRPEQADEVQELTGIPVVCVRINNQSTSKFSYALFPLIGKVIGEEERGKYLKKFLEDEMSKVRNKVSKIPVEHRVRGYVTFAQDPLKTDRHLDPMDSAGVINVANNMESKSGGSMGPWITVNIEQLAVLDPDIIFMHFLHKGMGNYTKEQILDDPQWQHLKAVKEGKVYNVIVGLSGWYPSMTVINTMQIAKISYPDEFTDLNVTAEGDKIYKELYGIEGYFSEFSRKWDLDVP